MTYTTIFEKLLTLINIVSSSYIYIGFGIISILLILLLIFRKISKKTCFIIISLLSKLVLGYTIYIYYDVISKLINDIVDNIFLNIYFPSIYAYLFILLIINIFGLSNILRPNGEKSYKTINGITLTITNFILILVLEVIAKNKIDIFTKESIFSNPTLITLLELSINVFIMWLISLGASYIINNITDRIILRRESKKLINPPAILNNELVINNNEIDTTYQESPSILTPVTSFIPNAETKFIPNFTISTKDLEEYEKVTKKDILEESNIVVNNIDKTISNDNTFDLSAFIPKKQSLENINTLNKKEQTTNEILDKVIANELPYIKKEKEEVIEAKNTFTLNDYRIFNKILKDIKEHNGTNSVTIDKMLEYRLITKYSNETYNMFKTMLKIYSN